MGWSDEGRIGLEGCCRGASGWGGAEGPLTQSEELAIAERRAVVWIIGLVEFRTCPKAESVAEAVNPLRPPVRIARAEGCRSRVRCRSKDTG